MKWYRVQYGLRFYHIRNPFTLWRFLHDTDTREWCDRLYNLMNSSELE